MSQSVKELQGAAPVFDHAHLSRYTMASAELEREIIGLFRMQLPDLISNLKGEASAADWKLFTHTLKGSARAVGAMQIGSIAERLETAPQRERPALLAELDAAVFAFESVIAQSLQ